VHVDLNLLAALDALLDENSVQDAAERMHLSAPAMSRTLARIRKATGDDILVRTGRTMTPTPRALALRDEVHLLVQRANNVLSPVQPFDPATLQRTFTIRSHDALTNALSPLLLETLRAHAPDVSLRFVAETNVDINDLSRGYVDLAIGSTEPTLPEICFELVGHDRLVVAHRANHPLANADLTIERFANADFVVASRRGRMDGPIDEALKRHGLQRRVIASLPTSTAALHLAATTDVFVEVADAGCREVRKSLGLHTRKIPLELSPIAIIQMWHRRYATDDAHLWLRNKVRIAITNSLEQTDGLSDLPKKRRRQSAR
jgi:DNA-binding transcriptional LysR family regulator